MRLLAESQVKLEMPQTELYETVRRMLKTNSNHTYGRPTRTRGRR
ncbi:protein of unknown function [Methylocaldum szegediense]|uniref:Uncharacterized protein n=1 Tax=Methylocaldum szegediense TaxID=73780 RepID=A0ABN8X011_9GAMM|nr:protein of unknown function [Methylocaldum szegediense]